jgi:hypothetical protein
MWLFFNAQLTVGRYPRWLDQKSRDYDHLAVAGRAVIELRKRTTRKMSSILSFWTLVLFVMSHAADARLPQAAVPPGDVLLTVKDVVGCYETSIKWPREFPAAARAIVTPGFSFFSSEPLAHSQGAYRIRLRDYGSVHIITSWRFVGPTELNAIWSTGYDGVAVVVRRRSTDRQFYGRAYTFSDMETPASASERPASPSDGTVILKPVPCWPGAS